MRVVLLAAVLLVATTGVAVAASKKVSFFSLAKGNGASSSISERKGVVIRRSATYLDYWRKLHAGEQPTPPAPKVDFSKNIVILVTQGQQSNGGAAIAVSRIRDSGARTTVSVRETTAGEGCVTTQVITSPYHLVRIRKTRDRVSYRRTKSAPPCGRNR